MSNSPLVFKKSKSKFSSRTRPTSPDGSAEIDQQRHIKENNDPPSTLATKIKHKAKRTQPRSPLSFGRNDDEESGGEIFKVKKSNLSRKLTLRKHFVDTTSNLDQTSSFSNHGPTYDEAYLRELKASTPSSRPASVAEKYDRDISMDVEEVVLTAASDTIALEAIIPTDSSIKFAKERREKTRKSGISIEEENFSSSVIRVSDEYQGPHPESRLMREDDDLGDGEDEFAEYTSAQDRIALGKKSRKLEESKRRDTMKVMIEDVCEEEDEESAEWEQEQLRRGGHLSSNLSTTSSSKVNKVYIPAPIPIESPVPTMESVVTRLSEEINQLSASHNSNLASIDALAKQCAEIEEKEKEIRVMVERAEEKRIWFDSFRDWLESMASFLDVKYPILEKLEQEHTSFLQERFAIISEQRREDDKHDLSAIFGFSPMLPSDSENKSDHLQHSRLSGKRPSFQTEVDYSKDFLDHSDMMYKHMLDSISSRSKAVLADVRAEEFLDPAKGLWGVWRDLYGESYVSAYGGLGIVSVWEFWARLEMVAWNCIEDSRSLDTFYWYQGLHTYCHPHIPDDDSQMHAFSPSPDGDLVSAMVSKAVIPKISAVIFAGAVDPYSERHIQRLVHVAEEIQSTVEGLSDANEKFESFVQSVGVIFRKAVEETELVIASFKDRQQEGQPVGFNPESIPARRRFLTSRIILAENLLKWRNYVKERSEIDVLSKRIVEDCFLDVALGGWEVGGEELSRKMVEVLPIEIIPCQLRLRVPSR